MPELESLTERAEARRPMSALKKLRQLANKVRHYGLRGSVNRGHSMLRWALHRRLTRQRVRILNRLSEQERWRPESKPRFASGARFTRVLGLSVPLDDINFNQDPDTGYVWPQGYVWDQEPLRNPLAPDVKFVWEINRLQHLTLEYPKWPSEIESTQKLLDDRLQEWVAQNPYLRSVNWSSPLEVAIRGITIALLVDKLRSSGGRVSHSASQLLGLHLDYLHTYGTRRWHPYLNNHAVGECCAEVLIGSLFPELSGARRGIDAGLLGLDKALRQLVSSDGVYREHALGYERFVCEFLALVCLRPPAGFDAEMLRIRVEFQKLLEHLLFSLEPGRTLPIVGDHDSGRALRLDDDATNRPRWLFAVGALLFARSDFRFAAADELSLDALLTTEQSLQLAAIEPEPPKVCSRHYPGGTITLRDSWRVDASYVFARCGEFDSLGEGLNTHSHCDLLSLVATVAGHPLFVDTGTYSYYKDRAQQLRHRSSASHNLPFVAGQSLADAVSLFAWANYPKVVDFISITDGPKQGFTARVEARHYSVNRRVELEFASRRMRISDRCVSKVAANTITTRWKLAPKWLGQIQHDSSGVTLSDQTISIRIEISGARTIAVANDVYCPEYGVTQVCPVVCVDALDGGTGEVETLVSW